LWEPLFSGSLAPSASFRKRKTADATNRMSESSPRWRLIGTHRITTCSCPGGSRRGAQCPTCGFSGKRNSGSKARVSNHHPRALPGAHGELLTSGGRAQWGTLCTVSDSFFSPDIPSPCQKKVKTLATYFTPCPTQRCQNRVANRVALMSVKSSIRWYRRP